ncbi:MAG: HAD-IIB family hydrolase [Hyphomicrobiaceae bacterium]
MRRLTPFSQMTTEALAAKRVVMLDVDDTLTTDGRLTPESYSSLASLKAAGLVVIPVTGRPAGWCDMIARFWPVDAVVGENGAFSFRYDHAGRRMHRTYAASSDERAAQRQKLDALARLILAEVPDAAIASDQSYREADLAIDFAEDVGPLDRCAVATIVRLFEEAGAVAKVSSIHVNGWFGAHDKLSTALRLLATEFDCGAEEAKATVIFVGDSPNDAPMFGYFDDAVGVANVLGVADLCPALPRWVTRARSGDGFVEVAASLLSSRNLPHA